jgi:hypothetical protein
MGKTTRLRKFAKHLLATTCLTAGTTAVASTVSEPPNFGTTFATATALPTGTSMVNGSVQFPSDTNDFFTFGDLASGTAFDFTASTTSVGLEVQIFNSSDTSLGGPFAFTSSSSAIEDLTAPANGQLVFDVIVGGGEGPARDYTIQVNTQTVAPEPGTVGAMGLGLAAGAAFLRRRRKKL